MRRTFIFSVFLIVCYSCRKEKETQPIAYLPVYEDLKQAFYYKPGTYWIYKDSLNGNVDSFAVVSSYLDSNAILPGKGAAQAYNVVINVTEFSISNGGSIVSTWKWQLMGTALYSNLYYDSGSLDYYTPFLYVPLYRTGMETSGPHGNHLDTDTFSACTVSGIVYRVAELHQYDNHHKYNDWFYVNGDVGIVKMRARCIDAQYHIWELQRCHIAK